MNVEIDMNDGTLWDKLELSDTYRRETHDYVKDCLGLISQPRFKTIESKNSTIQAFHSIGIAIRAVYNNGLSTSDYLGLAIDWTYCR